MTNVFFISISPTLSNQKRHTLGCTKQGQLAHSTDEIIEAYLHTLRTVSRLGAYTTTFFFSSRALKIRMLSIPNCSTTSVHTGERRRYPITQPALISTLQKIKEHKVYKHLVAINLVPFLSIKAHEDKESRSQLTRIRLTLLLHVRGSGSETKKVPTSKPLQMASRM